MGHNFYGVMMLDLCWYFTVWEYSRVTFTCCFQYYVIYCTRAVQIQQVVSSPRTMNLASEL
jgi:hypothetical protein